MGASGGRAVHSGCSLRVPARAQQQPRPPLPSRAPKGTTSGGAPPAEDGGGSGERRGGGEEWSATLPARRTIVLAAHVLTALFWLRPRHWESLGARGPPLTRSGVNRLEPVETIGGSFGGGRPARESSQEKATSSRQENSRDDPCSDQGAVRPGRPIPPARLGHHPCVW